MAGSLPLPGEQPQEGESELAYTQDDDRGDSPVHPYATSLASRASQASRTSAGPVIVDDHAVQDPFRLPSEHQLETIEITKEDRQEGYDIDLVSAVPRAPRQPQSPPQAHFVPGSLIPGQAVLGAGSPYPALPHQRPEPTFQPQDNYPVHLQRSNSKFVGRTPVGPYAEPAPMQSHGVMFDPSIQREEFNRDFRFGDNGGNAGFHDDDTSYEKQESFAPSTFGDQRSFNDAINDYEEYDKKSKRQAKLKMLAWVLLGLALVAAAIGVGIGVNKKHQSSDRSAAASSTSSSSAVSAHTTTRRSSFTPASTTTSSATHSATSSSKAATSTSAAVNTALATTGSSSAAASSTAKHVPNYHEWMSSEAILEATASEPLSLKEEYEMCELTFIVLRRLPDVSPSDPEFLAKHDLSTMIGDVNIFLSQEDESDDEETSDAPTKEAKSRAEVELMIAALDARRQGFGGDAIRTFLSYASQELKLKPDSFFAKIGMGNDASLRLFERLGFKEGKRIEVFQEVEMVWGGGEEWGWDSGYTHVECPLDE
ncbi:acyl-CoA N-acyltransferase [Pseudohyphozyma bogoriensis]|nr:acyl-CoA N-acyltransferase [Pseudohyphozyma bogoriensis]